MTGFNSKRQASKALLQQLLDALELDALEHPGTINNQIGWAGKARELCDALSAALFDRGAAVAEPLTEWQQIETAPKDGTDILGMYMHIETQIVHNIFWLDNEYEPEENGWWTYEYSEVSRMKLEGWMLPTHWIPLPAARGIKGEAA